MGEVLLSKRHKGRDPIPELNFILKAMGSEIEETLKKGPFETTRQHPL